VEQIKVEPVLEGDVLAVFTGLGATADRQTYQRPMKGGPLLIVDHIIWEAPKGTGSYQSQTCKRKRRAVEQRSVERWE
jgi:hypothetical protein